MLPMPSLPVHLKLIARSYVAQVSFVHARVEILVSLRVLQVIAGIIHYVSIVFVLRVAVLGR